MLKEHKAIQKYHLFKNFEAEVNSFGKLANEIFQVGKRRFLCVLMLLPCGAHETPGSVEVTQILDDAAS